MSTDGRPAPRLRAVVRRWPQLRHPDHGRAAVATARCGCASATRPRATRCATRSAATPGSRAAAAPTATSTRSSSTGRLQALRDLRHPDAQRPLARRVGRRRGACAATHLRPNGWTSADAAGLPILPGLLRWNEVTQPATSTTRSGSPPTSPPRRHVWPARHDAGSRDSRGVPADGGPVPAQGRLLDRAATRRHAREVIRAMKTLRPGPRRQRVPVVLPGRAEPRTGRTG